MDRNKQIGYIFDPTVRFEDSEDQPEKVDELKRAYYEPTLDWFKDKYQLKTIEIFGLFIGARGTISKFFINLMVGRFKLPKALIRRLIISVLKDSSSILHNHLYNNQ